MSEIRNEIIKIMGHYSMAFEVDRQYSPDKWADQIISYLKSQIKQIENPYPRSSILDHPPMGVHKYSSYEQCRQNILHELQ